MHDVATFQALHDYLRPLCIWLDVQQIAPQRHAQRHAGCSCWCHIRYLFSPQNTRTTAKHDQEGKGKAARRPPAQILSSQSAASPKKPKVIKQLLRSLTPHLHTGWKRTVPSRRCACGFLRQWTRWAATQPSGRRCILRCVTRIISSNPRLSTDLLLPLNDSYRPPSSLFFAFDKGTTSDLRRSFRSCSHQSHRDPVPFLSTVLPDVKSSAADNTSDAEALYPPPLPPLPSTLAFTRAGSRMSAICDVPLVPQIDYRAASTSTTCAAELEGAPHCVSRR